MIPISPTAMRTWLKCPALYEAVHVRKVAKIRVNKRMARGLRVHKLLEGALAGEDVSWAEERAIEKATAAFRSELLRARDDGAELSIELSCAVDSQGRPCDFFDSSQAFLRCRIDAMLVRDGRPPLLIDWKTGKPGGDDPSVQLAINCLCAAASLGPGEYEARLAYVDAGVMETHRIDVDVALARGLSPEIRARSALKSTLDKIEAMAEAQERGCYPCSRGRHCGWCDWDGCRYNTRP